MEIDTPDKKDVSRTCGDAKGLTRPPGAEIMRTYQITYNLPGVGQKVVKIESRCYGEMLEQLNRREEHIYHVEDIQDISFTYEDYVSQLEDKELREFAIRVLTHMYLKDDVVDLDQEIQGDEFVKFCFQAAEEERLEPDFSVE